MVITAASWCSEHPCFRRQSILKWGFHLAVAPTLVRRQQACMPTSKRGGCFIYDVVYVWRVCSLQAVLPLTAMLHPSP